MAAKPTWVTYNQQFQAAKFKNIKSKVIENVTGPSKADKDGDVSDDGEETEMS